MHGKDLRIAQLLIVHALNHILNYVDHDAKKLTKAMRNTPDLQRFHHLNVCSSILVLHLHLMVSRFAVFHAGGAIFFLGEIPHLLAFS